MLGWRELRPWCVTQADQKAGQHERRAPFADGPPAARCQSSSPRGAIVHALPLPDAVLSDRMRLGDKARRVRSSYRPGYAEIVTRTFRPRAGGGNVDATTWWLIAITVFAWGAWAITLKLGIGYGDPYSMVVWSSLFAVLLVPANWLAFRRIKAPLSMDARLMFWAGLGVVLSGAAVWTYTLALSRHQAGLITAVTASYPALTLALGAALLGERPTALQMAGVGLTVAGVLLLSR